MSTALVKYDGSKPDSSELAVKALNYENPEIAQPGLMKRVMQALRGDEFQSTTITQGVKLASRILVMIPAHNEAAGIRDCLEGLADQELPEDVDAMDILLIADNCSDGTEEVARQAGLDLGLSNNLYIFSTEGNKQRKVGALNAGWALVYGNKLDSELEDIQPGEEELAYRNSVKAVLGMDADSRLAPGAIRHLWQELRSSRDIGGVMCRYTMRLPRPKRQLDPRDPHYEEKVASGAYGGPFSRWWTAMQKQDMAAWLLNLFHRGGSTYVLGGQASLFRPEALAEVVNEYKLLGPWDPSTQVEDMKLTWMLQEQRWKTLVSPEARCYVDAMSGYHTFRQQRLKWDGGLVELLTSKDDHSKTRHTGFLWRQQLKMGMDLVVRILFFTLLGAALATDQFYWNWVFLAPPLVASVLNTRLALRVPQHRTIDIVLAATLVSPETYLLVRLIGWVQVWYRRLSVQERDGWEAQYAAQRGETKSKLMQGTVVTMMIITGIAYAMIHFHHYLVSASVQGAIRPYMETCFGILTVLTGFAMLAMLRQLWLLRAPYRP
ncbi:MAG TPA: glycosyltransferase family 2 protein [Candidatus Saccharimonadales bacterium]|nr:glycosyltransferase family 2 protein [Candidatus Saccharimonadales bacterium]